MNFFAHFINKPNIYALCQIIELNIFKEILDFTIALDCKYPDLTTPTLIFTDLADLLKIIITVNLVCQDYLNEYKTLQTKKDSQTIYFYLTEFIICVFIVAIGIRRMSSVVVIDDVSPVVLTADVDRIRYRDSGVVGVLKTQHSIFLVCCVGDKDRKSKESTSN